MLFCSTRRAGSDEPCEARRGADRAEKLLRVSDFPAGRLGEAVLSLPPVREYINFRAPPMTDHQKLIEELEAASDGCDMYARAAQAIRSLESDAASWKADAAVAHLENVRLRAALP